MTDKNKAPSNKPSISPVAEKEVREVVDNEVAPWLRRQHWIVPALGMLIWPAAQIIEGVIAALFSVVPVIGPMLVDNTLDTIMLFLIGAVPLACFRELRRRFKERKVDDDKNDAR